MRTLVKTECSPNRRKSLFDDFFSADFFNSGSTLDHQFFKATPAVNVKETSQEFVVEVMAPGIKKDDIKIELNDTTLSISYEHQSEKTDKDESTKYRRKEFSYSSFKRSFIIDENSIDTDKIDAKFENGVLHIHLAKKQVTPSEKTSKTIVIE